MKQSKFHFHVDAFTISIIIYSRFIHELSHNVFIETV
jgi:hypothetical protein